MNNVVQDVATVTAAHNAPEPPLTVTLPIPDAGLGKSAHTHHWTYYKLYADHRKWAAWEWQQSYGPEHQAVPWAAARLDIEWRYSRGREPDDGNAWGRCEAYRDGAQDALVVRDDRYITQGTMTFRRVARGEECVVLTLTQQHVAPPQPDEDGGRAE